MKIIFSTATIKQMNTQLIDAIKVSAAQFGVTDFPVPTVDDTLAEQAASTIMLKHIKVTYDEESYTIEVADELLVKYVALYARFIQLAGDVAPVIVPFVADVKQLVGEITTMCLETR